MRGSPKHVVLKKFNIWAKFSDHGIFKVGAIVSDDPFRDTILEDEVVLDELAMTFLVTEANEAASTHLVK